MSGKSSPTKSDVEEASSMDQDELQLVQDIPIGTVEET